MTDSWTKCDMSSPIINLPTLDEFDNFETNTLTIDLGSTFGFTQEWDKEYQKWALYGAFRVNGEYYTLGPKRYDKEMLPEARKNFLREMLEGLIARYE